MLHVFVYVVRSNQDHFAGVRRNLVRGGAETCDISFDDAEFDIIDSVEYTHRRPFRFWYYPKVFRSLEKRLDALFAANTGPVCIYFSDEGVWAVFWALYRRRLGRAGVFAINVQHGLALPIPANHRSLRRAINAMAIAFTGYPAIGYGSAGGAGPAPFDAYLTYDEAIAEFASRQSQRPAIAAPKLIKHQLISRFHSLPKVARSKLRILFTMNVPVPGSPILCGSAETYDVMLELAKAIRELGADLVFRFHPGMNREEETALFGEHPISALSSIDSSATLGEAMSGSDIVLSYFSTALWEGKILGLLPVQVICRCCKPVELGYARQTIDLSADLTSQLLSLLALAKNRQAEDWQSAEIGEWDAVKDLFRRIGCHV